MRSAARYPMCTRTGGSCVSRKFASTSWTFRPSGPGLNYDSLRAEHTTCNRDVRLMKIAVPVFGSRVSPRFDCAQVFLVVTAHEGNGLQREQLSATNWAPHERIRRLMELGVNAVVCGGIDWRSAETLRSAGIVVCSSITGDVDEALDAWLRGAICAGGCTQTRATMGRPAVGEGNRATAGESDDAPPPQFESGTRRRQRRRGGSGGRGAGS